MMTSLRAGFYLMTIAITRWVLSRFVRCTWISHGPKSKLSVLKLYWYWLPVAVATFPEPLLGGAGIGFPLGCPFAPSFWSVNVHMHVETNAPVLSCSENFTGTVLPLLKGWWSTGEEKLKAYLLTICAGALARPFQIVGSSGAGCGICAKFTWSQLTV